MGTSMPAPDDRNWRLSDIAVGAAHRAGWLPGGCGPLVAECLEDAPAQGVGRLLGYVVELHRQQPLRAADRRPDEAPVEVQQGVIHRQADLRLRAGRRWESPAVHQ